MPRKKTAAQLDREIATALTSRVTPAQLRRELDKLLERAGIDPDSVELTFSDKLDREHATNRRRYASVYLDARRIEVAHAILGLPKPHRLGILAHEVGHFRCDATVGRRHTEAQTDRCARKATGIRIGYDHSWPGKGLQFATNLAKKKLSRELSKRERRGLVRCLRSVT